MRSHTRWILSALAATSLALGCQQPASSDKAPNLSGPAPAVSANAPAPAPAPPAQAAPAQAAPAPNAAGLVEPPPEALRAAVRPTVIAAPGLEIKAVPPPVPSGAPQPGSPEFAAAAAAAGHAGCGAAPSPPPAAAAAGPQHFGAPFSLPTDSALPMPDAIKQVDALAGQPVLVSGTVTTVCRKKGCWMTMDAGPNAEPIRVTFKDYGFFVPLDADGSAALMEGILSVKEIPEAMRRHYAEDAGLPPDEVAKIQGSSQEVKFTASAVTLTRPAAP